MKAVKKESISMAGLLASANGQGVKRRKMVATFSFSAASHVEELDVVGSRILGLQAFRGTFDR